RDRPIEPREYPAKAGRLSQFPMRHRNAPADSGAAEPLAFGQHIIDRPLAAAGDRSGAPGDFLEGLLLAGCPQLGDDASWRKEIDDLHDSVLGSGLQPTAARPLWFPKRRRHGRDIGQFSHGLSRAALLLRLRPASSAGSSQPTLPSLRR